MFSRNDTEGREPLYYVDEYFDLYDMQKEPMYCSQIMDSTSLVRQNIFFYNTDLHVRCVTYLVLLKSEDRGESWSAPMFKQKVATVMAATFYFKLYANHITSRI